MVLIFIKMLIRRKFIGVVSPWSSLLPLGALRAVTGQRFILPFYHLISNDDCKHVKHLYRYKNPAEFEADLDYLALNYEPIGAGDLGNVLNGKYRNKKIMLLSFDDGLRQMYDVVAPILLRKGIPAIFFVNTAFVDNRKLMFRYKISLIIEQYGLNKANSSFLFAARNDNELNNKLNGKYQVDFTAFLQQEQPYMTTPQIKWLMEKGFSIGSHSVNHPYFEDITLEEQLKQVTDSLKKLEEDFGIQQKLFAFPFTDHGVSRRFFETIFSDKKVDFSFGSAGIKGDVNARHFQRMGMEELGATAEQILTAEYLYYLALMPLFKNAIKRN